MSWQDKLAQNVARALRLLGPEPKPWVSRRDGVDADVLIVGGGQGGLANAFALRRLGITHVSVIDAAKDEDQAGVWFNKARMEVLRTPKTATGPEWGIPELSFQAWHEAQHGPEAFQKFEFIPRTVWGEYLKWFRDVNGIKVRYDTRLVKIEPLEEFFRVHLDEGGVPKTQIVREIILVTGIEGCGAPNRPGIIADNLPASLYSHTADPIDFAAFAGKNIAVLGVGTSGFDAAAVAAETGAKSVHLFSRRKEIPNGGPVGPRGNVGALDRFHLLPDALRWEYALQMLEVGPGLPATALKRVVPLENFHLHLNSPFEAVRAENNKAVVRASGRDWVFDHVILGTGYNYDPELSPELTGLADKIAVWADRFKPAKGRENDFLGRHPYLGAGYEFVEKEPGTAPYLKHIHLSGKAGSISFGRPVGDIPNLLSGVGGISAAILHDLFFDDYADHAKSILAQSKLPYDRETYAKRIWADKVEEPAE